MSNQSCALYMVLLDCPKAECPLYSMAGVYVHVYNLHACGTIEIVHQKSHNLDTTPSIL